MSGCKGRIQHDRHPLTDTQSGYRLITAEVLQGLTLGAARYEGELEAAA